LFHKSACTRNKRHHILLLVSANEISSLASISYFKIGVKNEISGEIIQDCAGVFRSVLPRLAIVLICRYFK
jgi:hypothetical protein